ncbi:MAG: thiamine pyrophosphate-binding protein, partial [Planctomycetes bacterium]|nr:thiamine pyrophosphate-binding protein [Planctomycetota bacterium]
GFARATGEVGVAVTVPGPGASNAATGIADALNDCQPVLLITGGFDRSIQNRDRSKLFHGLDQANFFRPIVRYYGCPQSATEIPQVVQAAFAAIWAGRPGPAVLEIPPDVAAEEAGQPAIPERVVPRFVQAPRPAELQQAAALLRASTRPAILVGGDVIASGAAEAFQRLAVRLAVPVLHTRLGKGALPDDLPLNLGNSRHKRAREVLSAADALIAVGVRFTQIDSRDWKMPVPPCLIQFDRDPREIGREFPVTAGVVGDLMISIPALTEELGDWPAPGGWGELLPAIQQRHQRPPVPVLHEIRTVLDRSGILVGDITSLSYRAFDEYAVYGPRDFLYSCHYVTMGYGLPAALGAKVACPDRPVVAICGDGGVLMSIAELATAAQYNIAAVIVVVSDASLLAIKASQIKHYSGRVIDTELNNPDFVALARSFGAAGFRATDLKHFQKLLTDALAGNRPALIEVPMADRQAEIMQTIPWLHSE